MGLIFTSEIGCHDAKEGLCEKGIATEFESLRMSRMSRTVGTVTSNDPLHLTPKFLPLNTDDVLLA